MKPGIYLGMPEDEYHAVDARGSTDIKQLFRDPVEWQFDRLHGEGNKDTPSKRLGSAIHTRLLEGRDEFRNRFYRKLTTDDLDEPLVTVADLKDFLKDHSLPVSGKKADLIERIEQGEFEVQIWDTEEALYNEQNSHKAELADEQMRRVELASEWCQADKLIGPFMEDGTFKAGLTEVSVFCEIDGVPCKARYDKLLYHRIVDVKSYHPTNNWLPIYAIPGAIKKWGYDLQAGWYLEVWDKAKELWEAGKVFGDAPDGFFEKAFAEPPIWVWVFVKTSGAPQPFVAQFADYSTAMGNARRDAREGLLFYKQKVEEFGLNESWPPHNAPMILADEELAKY